MKEKKYNEPFHSFIQKHPHSIPKIVRQRIRELVMRIDNRKYDNVFSIGAECTTAQALRAASLRKFSSPLDWVSGTSLAERMKLINDDFKLMLKKDSIRISDIIGDTSLNTYRAENVEIGMIFPHDFPCKDIDRSFPIVYEKYQRRIKRLNSKIRSSKNLMVYMIEEGSDFDLQSINQQMKIMKDKFSPERLDLLYITLNKHSDESNAKVYKVSSSSDVYFVQLSRNSIGEQKWWHDNVHLHMEVSRWLNAVCA